MFILVFLFSLAFGNSVEGKPNSAIPMASQPVFHEVQWLPNALLAEGVNQPIGRRNHTAKWHLKKGRRMMVFGGVMLIGVGVAGTAATIASWGLLFPVVLAVGIPLLAVGIVVMSIGAHHLTVGKRKQRRRTLELARGSLYIQPGPCGGTLGFRGVF